MPAKSILLEVEGSALRAASALLSRTATEAGSRIDQCNPFKAVVTAEVTLLRLSQVRWKPRRVRYESIPDDLSGQM